MSETIVSGRTADVVYEFSWIPGPQVSGQPSLVQEMSDFYSHHYGRWSEAAPEPYKPGHSIKLPPTRIMAWLEEAECKVAFARFEGLLVGYAIAIQARVPESKEVRIVSWVTQLVVHEDHRTKDVGKRLLRSIWNFSNHYAWGLLTANPYAVRALEKATSRRSLLREIHARKQPILKFGRKFVKYFKIDGQDREMEINKNGSSINTEFFVDHSDLKQMVERVSNKGVPWTLGPLKEGWEWLAFTFRDQPQIEMSNEEIERMLGLADQVTQQAYSRMDMTNKGQRWSNHTKPEVDFILDHVGSDPRLSFLDLGCGAGRHSIELGGRGFSVDAVDYAESQILGPARNPEVNKLPVNFYIKDARTLQLGKTYSVVLCLYDVIGSFTDNSENSKILENIFIHLKPGGLAFISVMNYERTLAKAVNTFQLTETYKPIQELSPSPTMEETGDIFDPDYYLVDTQTHIIYRKEQFKKGNQLPEELLVRDRRFTMPEIESMCGHAGLEVIWSRYVGAGKWNESKSALEAKEILVFCRKPEGAGFVC